MGGKYFTRVDGWGKVRTSLAKGRRKTKGLFPNWYWVNIDLMSLRAGDDLRRERTGKATDWRGSFLKRRELSE